MSSALKALDGWQQRHRPVAFSLAVVKRFNEDRAGHLAAVIAYYGFFSLFPLLLVLVTSVGLILDAGSGQRVVDAALAQFPGLSDALIQELRALPGRGLGLALGIVGGLWAGLACLKAVQRAMDHVWDVRTIEQPGILRALVRSIIVLATLGVFIVMSSVLGATSAGMDGSGPLRIVGVLVATGLNVGVFLVAFRVLTVADVRWGDVLPGAMVAAIGWTGLQLAGGFIIGYQLERASTAFGAYATVFALLTWMFLGAQLTLFAAEINVVRARHLWPRALRDTALTSADRRALRSHAEVEERVPDQEVDVTFTNASTRQPSQTRPD